MSQLQLSQRSQRSQRSYGNQSTAIATIVKIAAIVHVLRSQRFYGIQFMQFYGNQSSAIVNDHMETEGGLHFGKGPKNSTTMFSHSDFGITLKMQMCPQR